jgi:site-specific DNA recombinase
MAPELVKEFIAEFHREVNRQRREQEAGQGLKRRELEEVTRKLDGLINAIADGLRTPGVQKKLEELESRKAALETDLADAAPPAPLLHPNLAEVYRQKVAGLQEALDKPETQTEALEILRGLVERVVLHPVEGGGLEIELIGAIAAMVDLGANNKKADPEGAVVPEAYRCSCPVRRLWLRRDVLSSIATSSGRSGQTSRTHPVKHAENSAGSIRFINSVSQRAPGTP